MFRYRMNTRSKSRLGVVVVLILVGILLIWVAAHMGDSPQQDIDQPTATEAGVDNLLLRLYQGVRAAGVAFWQQFMGFGSSESIPVDIDLTGAQSVGAGEDDPEEEVIPDEGVKVEVVDPQEPESFGAAGAAPQILIYHTHTHESYTKTAGQNYVESAQWRTTNNDYNIVRVGEELAKTLSEKYGIAVLHDKTDNEYPQLGTAYSRSLITMQKDMKANPGLKLLIDLHRDAYNTGIDPSVATIDGQKVARVMAVIGTGTDFVNLGGHVALDERRAGFLLDVLPHPVDVPARAGRGVPDVPRHFAGDGADAIDSAAVGHGGHPCQDAALVGRVPGGLPPHVHVHLLGHFGCVVGRAHHPEHEPVDARRGEVVQLGERVLVAPGAPGHEFGQVFPVRLPTRCVGIGRVVPSTRPHGLDTH